MEYIKDVDVLNGLLPTVFFLVFCRNIFLKFLKYFTDIKFYRYEIFP